MCKVFGFSNFSKVKKPVRATNIIAAHVTATEKDGFGYAILGTEGVYGEKYVGKEDFMSVHGLGPDKQMDFAVKNRSSFGLKSKNVGPAIFHGRTSTNSKGLANCHPMQRGGFHLIHNGVVSNKGPAYDNVTNNDSEHVVHYLATKGIEGIAQNLTGYYAFMAIGPDGKLHVAKDSIANLHCAWVESLDSYVFGTTESLIVDCMAELGIKHGPIYAVANDTYLLLQKNEVLEYKTFKSRGYEYNEAKWASKSLGRELSVTESKNGHKWIDSLPSIPSYANLDADLESLTEIVNYNYDILDAKGEYVDAWDFKKMDRVQQGLCTIYSPEGILLYEPGYYYGDKKA